jgi:hypothetical protein
LQCEILDIFQWINGQQEVPAEIDGKIMKQLQVTVFLWLGQVYGVASGCIRADLMYLAGVLYKQSACPTSGIPQACSQEMSNAAGKIERLARSGS